MFHQSTSNRQTFTKLLSRIRRLLPPHLQIPMEDCILSTIPTAFTSAYNIVWTLTLNPGSFVSLDGLLVPLVRISSSSTTLPYMPSETRAPCYGALRKRRLGPRIRGPVEVIFTSGVRHRVLHRLDIQLSLTKSIP